MTRGSSHWSVSSRSRARSSAGCGRGTTVIEHPQVGRVELSWEKLEVSGSPGQTLVIHQAEPGSASERALALLASLAAEAPPVPIPS